MRSRRLLSALSAVLISLVWPTAQHLTAHPNYLLAMVLCAAGIGAFAAAGAARGANWRRRLAGGISAAGPALLAGAVSTPVLRQIAWRLHQISLPVPEGLVQTLPARMTSVVAYATGRFTLWSGEHSDTVQLTCEALGLYVIWYLVVTLSAVSLLSPRRGGRLEAARGLAISAASIFVYAAFRFGVLAALAVELDKPGLFWQHAYTVASWLPLAVLLRLPKPPSTSVPETGAVPDRVGVSVARSAPLVLAGLCLGFAAAYNDPGHVKPGRVLIDESHSNWEWTRERFDTTAFGIRAEYNYYCLSEYLSHFYAVTALSAESAGSLSKALDDADVLVIKTPTKAYSASEIAAIVEFVRRGGGLLLIGDHTNLFGMSTYLNSIASRFDLRFRFDDTFDLETTAFSTFRRPRIWFHPAVRRATTFEFLTSCTVEGGPGTEAVMIGEGLGSEEADYAHPNFFGNITFDLGDRFGIFLQAAARRYGKGRVLLFTDSTCFSNFCIFSPGKPEVACGFIDYLNRCGERYPQARSGSVVLACLLIGLSLVAGLGTGVGRQTAERQVARWLVARRQIAWPTLGAGLALVLGIAATSRLNAQLYGPIREVRPLRSVVFETAHCSASFFDYMGVAGLPREQRFEELYMCAQRLGLHPRRGSASDLGGAAPLAFVVVNPVREFGDDEIGEIGRYVAGGGVLVVMDRGPGGLPANRVLRPFGLEAQSPGILPAANVVTTSFGQGKVVVCLNSWRYCEAMLGRPLEWAPPSAEVNAIYREAFAILIPS